MHNVVEQCVLAVTGMAAKTKNPKRLRKGLAPCLGTLDRLPEACDFLFRCSVLARQVARESNGFGHLRQGGERREDTINRHACRAHECAEILTGSTRNQQEIRIEAEYPLGVGCDRRAVLSNLAHYVADVRQVSALADRHDSLRWRDRIHILVDRPVLRHDAPCRPGHPNYVSIAIHGLARVHSGARADGRVGRAAAGSVHAQAAIGRNEVFHRGRYGSHQNCQQDGWGQARTRAPGDDARGLHHARDQRGPVLPFISRREFSTPAVISALRAKSHKTIEIGENVRLHSLAGLHEANHATLGAATYCSRHIICRARPGLSGQRPIGQ